MKGFKGGMIRRSYGVTAGKGIWGGQKADLRRSGGQKEDGLKGGRSGEVQ